MIWIVLLLLMIITFWRMGQSDWHLKRNKHNKLPEGKLTLIKDKEYKDEAGLIWILQPAIKNKFHQPDHEIEPVENPYPNVEGTIVLDTKNPNLKFLSPIGKSASFEAILQPNGEYLTQGVKQGTYNYGHPSGLVNTLKHVIYDVIPHFINSKYE